MPRIGVPARMKSVLFALCFLVAPFPRLELQAASCSYFAETFSGPSSHSWTIKNANWYRQDGAFHVTAIPSGKMATAQVAFDPAGFYIVDVDVSLSGSGSDSAFGILPFTSGGPFFSVSSFSTDGIGGLVYPNLAKAYLFGWDVGRRAWQLSSPLNLSSTITSVGVQYESDRVVLRLNKQNTALSMTGNFADVGPIDRLWLVAEGTQTHAVFDNVCAGPVPVQYALSVVKSGEGSGTVTSSPEGIDCGGDCAEAYDEDTSVTLIPTPAANSNFAGWSGGGCSGAGGCVVQVSANLTVTATFSPKTLQPAEESGATIYFPFYQADASTFTGFAVSNYSEFDAQLEFRAYQTNGQAAYVPRQFALAPHRQLALLGHEIFQVPGSSVQSAWVELTTDNPEIGSFFQFGATTQMDGSTPFTEAVGRLVFTRVFHGPGAYRGQTAETWLSVANPSAEAVEIRLELKSDAGAVLASRTRTLAAKGFFYESTAQLFGAPGSTTGGYVDVLTIQGAGVIGFELIKVPSKPTVIGLSGQPPGAAAQLFSAQLATLPGFFTNIKLVNTASAARQVTLTAVSESGQSLAAPVAVQLAAGQTLERDAAGVFGFSPAQVTVGSLRVEADGPGVLGDVVFGDDASQTLAAALPLQTEKLTKAVFSQVVNQWGAFYTGVALYNPGLVETEAKIEVYRAEGAMSGSCAVRLGAGQRIARLLTEWMPSTEGQVRGYVVITSPQPLIAQLMFGSPTLLSAVPPTRFTWSHLVSGTIGPKGGTLSAEGFSLTVPAGAFADNEALRIETSEEPSSFGSHPASLRYQVLGLPGGFSKALDVAIPLTVATREETFLLVKTTATTSDLLEEVTAYRLEPGQIASQKLLSAIPAISLASEPALTEVTHLSSTSKAFNPPERVTDLASFETTTARIEVEAQTARTTKSTRTTNSFGLCTVNAPSGFSRMGDVLDACVEAVDLLQSSVGLMWPIESATPVRVTVDLGVLDSATQDEIDEWGDNAIGVKGSTEASWLFFLPPRVTVDQRIVGLDTLRATTAHEVFHFLQAYVTGRTNRHLWLTEATAVWLQRRMIPTDCASEMTGNIENLIGHSLFRPQDNPLTGGSKKAAEQHGYAASVFIRWLVETGYPALGDLLVGDLMEAAGGQWGTPAGWNASFTTALGDGTWNKRWGDFIDALAQPETFGGCPAWANRMKSANSWVVTGDAPAPSLSKTFAASLPPLSGVLYRVQVQPNQVSKPAWDRLALEVKVTGLPGDLQRAGAFLVDEESFVTDLGEVGKNGQTLLFRDMSSLKVGRNSYIVVALSNSSLSDTVSSVLVKFTFVPKPAELWLTIGADSDDPARAQVPTSWQWRIWPQPRPTWGDHLPEAEIKGVPLIDLPGGVEFQYDQSWSVTWPSGGQATFKLTGKGKHLANVYPQGMVPAAGVELEGKLSASAELAYSEGGRKEYVLSLPFKIRGIYDDTGLGKPIDGYDPLFLMLNNHFMSEGAYSMTGTLFKPSGAVSDSQTISGKTHQFLIYMKRNK